MVYRRDQKLIGWVGMICLLLMPGLLIFRDASAAESKSARDFYKDAIIKMMVSAAPGGAQDMRVRTLAPFFERHSGAKLVIENRPGAGGFVAVSYLYNQAKPNGLSLCCHYAAGPLLAQLFGQKEATWKMEELSYVVRIGGGVGQLYGVAMVGRKSPIHTLDDLLKTKREIKFAVPNPSVGAAYSGALIAEAFDLKYKLTPGYGGGRNVYWQ